MKEGQIVRRDPLERLFRSFYPSWSPETCEAYAGNLLRLPAKDLAKVADLITGETEGLSPGAACRRVSQAESRRSNLR